MVQPPPFVTPPRVAAFAFALVVGTASLPGALAQTAGEKAAAAQALFDEAMRLMKAGQAAEACPKLEESQRLDAGMATQFRLAECYEKTGKLASAWASFVAVADAAVVARLPDRESAARKRAEALAPRLSRLTLIVPPAVAAIEGLDVQRDGGAVGRPLWGVPVPVDPGDHLLTVTAPGKKSWEGRVSVGEGSGSITYNLPLLEDAPLGAPPPPMLPPEAPSIVPAAVLGGVAAAAAISGVVLFVQHTSRQSQAESTSALIKSAHGTCVLGATADPRCSMLASEASSADTMGNASTVAFSVGGAAAAAMTGYLIWRAVPARAPVRGLGVAPALGQGRGGLFVTGSF